MRSGKLNVCSANTFNTTHHLQGVVIYIAQMITIPLLALVFVWLLSQVTLEVTFVSGTNLQVDLSDPRLLATVSFLVGSRPWAVWKLLQETAGEITGQKRREPLCSEAPL